MVGLALVVRPELCLAPSGGSVGVGEDVARLWGRIVAAAFLLLGGLVGGVGLWNLLFT